VVRRRIGGVDTGGVPWTVGNHCLYSDTGGKTRFGTVLNMFHGVSDMDEDFVIFELQDKPISNYMGHYCILSDDGFMNVLVVWHEVIWKCKQLRLGENNTIALPFASCTPNELIEFKR